MERRKEEGEWREAALKEQQKIEEEVVSTGTLPWGREYLRWYRENADKNSYLIEQFSPSFSQHCLPLHLYFVPLSLVIGGISQAAKCARREEKRGVCACVSSVICSRLYTIHQCACYYCTAHRCTYL